MAISTDKKIDIAKWLLDSDGVQMLPEDLAYLEARLRDLGLWKIYDGIELPLAPILDEMKKTGIKVDASVLAKLEKELTVELKELTAEIYKSAGEEFNINSPKQLSEILFKKLKIVPRGVKTRKTGAYSTDAETLEKIKDLHPVASALLKYRELSKLLGTYVTPFRELAENSKDERIHTTFLQTATATGRLASENPNLQNIPTGTDWAKKLRSAFVPEKGKSFLSLDYSQIELRILASVSGDPKMVEAFQNDQDIHKITASNVLNIPLEKITKEQRQMAKTLNFGIIYGMGPMAFSRQTGLSYAESEEFIAEYFNDFSEIKIWQDKTVKKAEQTGYVETLNGRKRWLPNIISPNPRSASEARRMAINMPIQGLAADIIKLAMIKVRAELPAVPLLLSIHDELVFEVSDDMLKVAEMKVKNIMENVFKLNVPLKVDSAIGKNWVNIS